MCVQTCLHACMHTYVHACMYNQACMCVCADLEEGDGLGAARRHNERVLGVAHRGVDVDNHEHHQRHGEELGHLPGVYRKERALQAREPRTSFQPHRFRGGLLHMRCCSQRHVSRPTAVATATGGGLRGAGVPSRVLGGWEAQTEGRAAAARHAAPSLASGPLRRETTGTGCQSDASSMATPSTPRRCGGGHHGRDRQRVLPAPPGRRRTARCSVEACSTPAHRFPCKSTTVRGLKGSAAQTLACRSGGACRGADPPAEASTAAPGNTLPRPPRSRGGRPRKRTTRCPSRAFDRKKSTPCAGIARRTHAAAVDAAVHAGGGFAGALTRHWVATVL